METLGEALPKEMTTTEKIADLEADRLGWICGLGADAHTDRIIRREIKKIDKKMAELKRPAAKRRRR